MSADVKQNDSFGVSSPFFFKLNFKQNFSFEHIAFIDSGIILFDEQMDPRKASIFISILISVLGIVILVSNMRVHWSLVMNKRNWFCVSGYKHRANEGVCFFGEVKMRAHTLRVWTNEMARFFHVRHCRWFLSTRLERSK